jgi:hypothetical protein
MNFRDMACAHLSEYRKIILGIDEEGIFNYGGREHRKGHVLPSGSKLRNLLEPYGNSFRLSEHGQVKHHQFFHHLNSSQALCFNLFFPLLVEGEHALLAQSLRSTIQPPYKSTFEKESDIEQARRRTSFDFHIRDDERREVFIEVKYTEDGFGGAKNDEEHQYKFRNTYEPLLQQNEYLKKECRSQTFFLKNYQILRNMVHITPQSEVRFLIPRANTVVAKQAENAREEFLSESGRKLFRIIYLEDLVSHLIDACQGGKLDGYYQSFDQKYLEFLRKAQPGSQQDAAR